MLPAKTTFTITSANIRPMPVLSLKLPEDIASKLLVNNQDGIKITLSTANPADNKLILADGTVLSLTNAPETQTVDVARSNFRKKTVQIVGRVKGKLAVKQELAQDKASAIRLQSQLAEKERLSRKTVTIEAPSKNNSTKTTNGAASRNRLMQRVITQKKPAVQSTVLRAPVKPKAVVCERLEQASTQSWSPPIDVFSKPAEEAVAPTVRPPVKKVKSADSLTKLEPAPVVQDPQLLRLQNQYRERLGRYNDLEKWISKRLEIFEQLQKDLKTAEGKVAATEKITNRVSVETANLKADREYKWKMAELDQLRGELESIKSKLAIS